MCRWIYKYTDIFVYPYIYIRDFKENECCYIGIHGDFKGNVLSKKMCAQ